LLANLCISTVRMACDMPVKALDLGPPISPPFCC
jgi:hypothetical protein